jgi:voltage-gated potassium channel
VPVTERARLIDAILVTPARLIFIMIFVGTAYELVIQRWVEGFRMARMHSQLREILGRGVPAAHILVVDLDESALQAAVDLHLSGLRGDACRADVLEDAAVERARAVVVCAGTDAVNALISLAARHKSKSRLVVAAEGLDTTELLRHSGADAVISAPALGGYVLADALRCPDVADMLVWPWEPEAQQVAEHDHVVVLRPSQPRREASPRPNV